MNKVPRIALSMNCISLRNEYVAHLPQEQAAAHLIACRHKSKCAPILAFSYGAARGIRKDNLPKYALNREFHSEIGKERPWPCQ
ncbi:hypothetical protein JCM17843_12790 [Kordiimonadales bacterium JCM 17843]|nr:hypothetical protein JCM17843_12790 [Kordiimonadales bacterium JCM 17843]